jgi:O-acetyl-ADP-ribose deacetylase (regulator of RNase III)
MIIYKVGDVLNAGETVVVHGCNCKCTMGSGIARQVREECPNAYNADQATLWGDKEKLGTYTSGVEKRDWGYMNVINAYTQYDYGHSKRYLDYDALVSVFERICQDFEEDVIAMPKIGCGLARGDWQIVEMILVGISMKYNKTFHVYVLSEDDLGFDYKRYSKMAITRGVIHYRRDLDPIDWEL